MKALRGEFGPCCLKIAEFRGTVSIPNKSTDCTQPLYSHNYLVEEMLAHGWQS